MLHFKKTISTIFLLLAGLCAWGQTYSEEDILKGYIVKEQQVTLLFSPSLYEVKPSKVIVTGSFRGWSKDMEEPQWNLKPTGDLWTLSFDNTDFAQIPAGSQFKFRVDNGKWLDPPKGATNVAGGNLVFMKLPPAATLKAEIRDEYTIWATVENGKRPLSKEDYTLTTSEGKEIKIAGVLPNTATETLISTAEPIDKTRVYYLKVPSLKLKAWCSYDGWFRELYSAKKLGATVENGKTHIRVFAPRATMLKVYLYKGKDDEKAYATYEMAQDAQGVWEIAFDEDLHGVYYDLTVHGAKDPGNHFYESEPEHISDPYTRVSDDTWGKCRIWRKTTPATPLKNGVPKLEDVIAYEVHVQDFTDRLPVKKELKGTIKAMTVAGLKNSRGEKIGFDYLLDLGINTVHLMPVQEYLHHQDEDWKASFKDDPYMIEQGVSEENYQWGYRTSHCFAIESRYRTKGKQPGEERDEFRDLVQAFHDQDIAVIIDIVPNHTAENMDGNAWLFNFNALDKIYYYRTKDLEHIGEYGNEVKTENRPMVQRWLIDQCKHFIEEFGIDGFRIDLAGQVDEQTLHALKEAIGHDKILYGEPWIGSNDPNYEANPDWDWYKEDSPITFFQDDSRTAYKGPVFDLADRSKDRGWAGGNFSLRENVMKGLANRFNDDKSPLSGISYLDIHDNYALADQFASKDWDGRFGVDDGAYKIATTLLYTTLGPIVTHGGTEMIRSKGFAPLKEVVKKTNGGITTYFHGKRDTYNHRIANHFVWENVGKTPTKETTNDYKTMYAFWRGLNNFRSSEIGKVFRVAEAVPDSYYQWITPSEEHLLGYIVDNKVFVLLNAGSTTSSFNDVQLPAGSWKLIGNNQAVDHKNGVKDSNKAMQLLEGGNTMTLELQAESLYIWAKE